MFTPSTVRDREIKQVCDENMVVILEACDQIDKVRVRIDTLNQTHGLRAEIWRSAGNLQDATVSLYSVTTKLCKQLRGIRND